MTPPPQPPRPRNSTPRAAAPCRAHPSTAIEMHTFTVSHNAGVEGSSPSPATRGNTGAAENSAAPTTAPTARKAHPHRALVAALRAAPQPQRNGTRPPTWRNADEYDVWRTAFDACERSERARMRGAA